MTAVPRWETVEQVAKALAAADRNDEHDESVDCFYAPPWESAGEAERNYWRKLALAALDVVP